MTASWMWWGFGFLMGLAAVMQVITLKRHAICYYPMILIGKRVMAVGFALASLRYFYLALNPDAPFMMWGVAAFGLVALGSIFANCARLMHKRDV